MHMVSALFFFFFFFCSVFSLCVVSYPPILPISFRVTSLLALGQLEQLERLRSEIPTAAPWLPILVIHITSRVKTRQSQSYKFKKIAKNTNFEILPKTLYATHLLKLLDKMYKYEMDATKTVGATERTRDAGRTDGQTDGRTDGRMEWNQYTPQQLRCAKGIMMPLPQCQWSNLEGYG